MSEHIPHDRERHCDGAGCERPATTTLPNKQGERMYWCDYHVGFMIAWVVLLEATWPPEERKQP